MTGWHRERWPFTGQDALVGPHHELAALWRWFVTEEASGYPPHYTAIVEAAAADDELLGLVAPGPETTRVAGAERSVVSKKKDGAMVVGLIGVLVADVAMLGIGSWASRRLLGPTAAGRGDPRRRPGR